MPSPGAHVPATIPPDTRRMVICVPDSVEWLTLVTGCLAQLTFGWYYNKASGDYDAVRDRAKQMYFEFQDQNGLCDVIDCDEVADCIESSERAQNAIRAIMNAGLNPGEKLSSTNRNANQAYGTNPSCDPDILWAQCIAIIKRMNDFISGFIALVETQTNSVEVGTTIASLPGIENLGVSSITNLADILFAAPGENYETDYAMADGMGVFWWEAAACAIFCACKDDCTLSIERIWNVFQNRIKAQLTGLADDWTDLLAWALDVANLDITSINMADFFYYLAFSGLRLGGILIVNGSTGDKVLQIAAQLAADEPSNDWIALCSDCPPACNSWNFLLVSGEPYVFAELLSGEYQSQWVSGQGWKTVQRSIWRNQICVPLDTTCTKITPHWTQAGTLSVHEYGWFNSGTAQYSKIANFSSVNSAGTHSETITINYASKPVWADCILLALSNTTNVQTVWTNLDYSI